MRQVLTAVTNLATPAGFQFALTPPPGGYSLTPIFWQDMPASPDRAVCITALPVRDNVSMPLGLVLVQVRTRGRPGVPLDCDDDADAIFDVLHGVTGLDLGSLSLVQVRRQLSAPMGIDDLKRRERADHYELDVDFPPTNLRPGAGAW